MPNADHVPVTLPEAERLLDLIDHADNGRALNGAASKAAEMMLALQERNHGAAAISNAVSRAGRAVARRLLVLAERDLGSAPVAYVFVVAGSQARGEQIAGSDQDNGMILSNDYRPDRHGSYFSMLAERVCTGLSEAGYRRCAGDIMATNPHWRRRLSDWQERFRQWIDLPDPDALLKASIFFDLYGIHGDPRLLEALRSGILEQTRCSTLFQARLTAVALGFRPALGWFGRLRFDRDGHSETMDLKRHAVTPVVDLARVHALAAGEPALDSRQRLHASVRHQLISPTDHDRLIDAFEQVSAVRIDHQCRQLRAGQCPDYRLDASELDQPARRQLKAALITIQRAQQAMARRYQAEAFR